MWRELTHTTIFTKLFKGENKHIYNIYKSVQGREQTHTIIFTKLFMGKTNTNHDIYKTIEERELEHTTIISFNISFPDTVYKMIIFNILK
jgi:hypothetical protein